MAGLPTVQVLLDDGTGTFPYDITAYVQTIPGYSLTRGRQDEMSSVTAGQLTGMTVDNTDGRFSPGSTLIATPSPIVANQRIRVKLTANATTVNRFTGYVQQWPVTWPDGSDQRSWVTIVVTDAQARAERQKLRAVLIEEAAVRTPLAHYALGDPSGATGGADSSGSQYPLLANLSNTTVVFGTATGPPTDGLTAATFTNTSALAATWAAPSGTGWSYVVFFNSAGPAAIDRMVISVLPRAIATAFSVYLDGAGKIEITPGGSGGPYGASLNNSQWHVFGISVDASGNYTVAVDAATVGTGTNASLAGMPTGLQLGSARGGPVSGLGDDVGYAGSLAHAIVFNSTLSAASLNAIGQAGLTGFANESGTARLTRTASYAGLPVGSLDTSLTNVPFTDITSKSAADTFRAVADAEMGILFFDGSGNLTFHNRNRPALKTSPDITIDANQLSEDTSFIYDMQGVLNHYEVTALGTTNGVFPIENAASKTTHGEYPGSASYLVLTDQEALDRGNWIVTNHAQPAARVGTLVIDALTSMTAAQQAAILALEANTWIQVTGLPSQAPGGTTANFMVQGFTERLTATEWTITANVVNRSLFTAFILDDATYGVLDSNRLYV